MCWVESDIKYLIHVRPMLYISRTTNYNPYEKYINPIITNLT